MNDLPPPVPAPLPPMYRDQRKADADHLRLLSIFSYVSAGLALLGLLFILFHYMIMHTMFSNPAFLSQPQPGGLRRTASPPDMQQFFRVFIWFYIGFGVWGLLLASLNVLSGIFLSAHKNRTFSLIVAGLNCVRVPLGTVLGVFTLVVLLRESVAALYAAKDAGTGGS